MKSPLEALYDYAKPKLIIAHEFVKLNILWIVRMIYSAIISAFVFHFIFKWVGI